MTRRQFAEVVADDTDAALLAGLRRAGAANVNMKTARREMQQRGRGGSGLGLYVTGF